MDLQFQFRDTIMKSYADIRLSEQWASAHLSPYIGEPMPMAPTIRQIKLDVTDPRVDELAMKLRTAPVFSANVCHEYEPEEIADAEILLLIFKKMVETYGAQWGTEYDDSRMCPKCGFGRAQVSELRINCDKFPNCDFLLTAAYDEWLVSERVAELVRKHGLTGCELKPIANCGRKRKLQTWFQFVVTERSGRAVAPTHFGMDFLNEDTRGEYTCVEHSHSGLNLLSQLSIARNSKPTTDVARTTNRVGRLAGWSVPYPMFLVSPRFGDLLSDDDLKGYELAPVNLVDTE
jgi:hypothetical protein